MNSLLVILFLNELKLISFHTIEWFQSLNRIFSVREHSDNKNSI